MREHDSNDRLPLVAGRHLLGEPTMTQRDQLINALSASIRHKVPEAVLPDLAAWAAKPSRPTRYAGARPPRPPAERSGCARNTSQPEPDQRSRECHLSGAATDELHGGRSNPVSTPDPSPNGKGRVKATRVAATPAPKCG